MSCSILSALSNANKIVSNKIESRMIESYSPDWFILELGGLNTTWNTFHMNLEKGEAQLPDGVLSTVKMMHNRWNSILKLIF